MRVTNSMMTNNMLRNLNSNLRDMDETQEKLSTGKRINSPSTDPSGLVSALSLRSEEGELSQYQSNVDDAASWLESTDSALGEVGDILQRVRELTLYGANDSMDDKSRESLAEEVRELRDHMFQVANSDFGGQHIFGGEQTVEEPFVKEENENGEDDELYDVNFNGNDAGLDIDVSPRVTVSKNLAGEQVFGELPEDDDNDEVNNVFEALEGVYQSLKDGEVEDLSGEHVEELDKWINNNLENRAEVGARINRLEMSKNRLGDVEHLTKVELSEVEEADMAKTIMDLKNQENVHRMALNSGARIIQPTLMDFLH